MKTENLPVYVYLTGFVVSIAFSVTSKGSQSTNLMLLACTVLLAAVITLGFNGVVAAMDTSSEKIQAKFSGHQGGDDQ